MEQQITKAGLLRELRAARAEWDALMAEVGAARMIAPTTSANPRSSCMRITSGSLSRTESCAACCFGNRRSGCSFSHPKLTTSGAAPRDVRSGP